MNNLPSCVEEMSNYMRVIKNRSAQTIEQYQTDIVLFLKYIKASREGLPLEGEQFDSIDVSGCDLAFMESISTEEAYKFFNFTIDVRKNKARARARKLSSLKSFYKYLTVTKKYFEKNPIADIDSPSIRPSLPKYLSIDESIGLLESVEEDENSKNKERDYAIITLFLNSGMRLSELVGINMSDIDNELRSLRVIGKGSKERIVYLNDASKAALTDWMAVRKNIPDIKDRSALFISSRKSRISKKTVQWIVYKYLDRSGLEYKHYSVHKLRHTAATLMYQTGKVDVRVLKDILGHEQLNTTQIYTHVSDKNMESAMNANPLAGTANKKRIKKDEE